MQQRTVVVFLEIRTQSMEEGVSVHQWQPEEDFTWKQRTVVTFRRRARGTHNTEPVRAIARLVDKNNCAYHVVFSVSVFPVLKNLFVCACLNGRFFSCRSTDVCGHFGLSFVGIRSLMGVAAS